jgi:hypothetical protein
MHRFEVAFFGQHDIEVHRDQEQENPRRYDIAA